MPAHAGGARDAGSIPGSGRPPGEGHGSPLQYSSLRIPWTEQPGGLQSVGSQRDTIEATWHAHILIQKYTLKQSAQNSLHLNRVNLQEVYRLFTYIHLIKYL